jgi:putative aminopeptidase FrvX
MKELIARLTAVFGPSGYEDRIRGAIVEEIKDSVDEHRVDALGNLIAVKRAAGPKPRGGEAGPPLKVMLAAHMDEIGIMVTYVDEKGFCRFATVGGSFPEMTLGARVVFASGIVGTFGFEGRPFPESSLKREDMYLDVGATSRADCPVKVGDPAAFQHTLADLGQRLLAHNFDDRIGCAILVQVLRELDASPHDVYAVFTVQEEVGTRGAITSSYGIDPDLAVAIDVTATGDTPEAHPMGVVLGAGPAIKVMDRGTVVQPAIKQLLIDTAEAAGVRYQLEVLEFGHTDAYGIQMTREGVPSGVVSIPSRYLHTTSQMVDYGDVTGAVALLEALLSRPIRI